MPARDEPDLAPVLADAVRRAYVWPVDEVTASRHVEAMIAAADAGQGVPARPPRRGRRPWRPALGAGAVVALLLPVGLATAGVSLPAAVEKPYSAVGIELPNQTPAPAPTPKQPSVPATPHVPPATATSTAPQASGASGTGRAPAALTPARRGKSSTAARPPTSRRPSTPPPAASPGSGAKKPDPSARRPAVAPGKPVAPKRVRPARPAKPLRPLTPAQPIRPANPSVTAPGKSGSAAPQSQHGKGPPNAGG